MTTPMDALTAPSVLSGYAFSRRFRLAFASVVSPRVSDSACAGSLTSSAASRNAAFPNSTRVGEMLRQDGSRTHIIRCRVTRKHSCLNPGGTNSVQQV
jgi:hypothetical protein